MAEKIKSDRQRWDNNINIFFDFGARYRFIQYLEVEENQKMYISPTSMKSVSWMQLGKIYFVARDICCLDSIRTMRAKGMMNKIRIGMWEL